MTRTAPAPATDPRFTAAAERHRRELLVHCYRMLGSLADAEDAVQETYLRAWRYRDGLKDGAPLRPWLYRIATNVCLDAAARERRAGEVAEVTWLRPIPDALLEPATAAEEAPDALVVTKETIELAFLAAIQLLTPPQRAALILRDVLGWSAREAAELLETTVAAVNGALQRARATLRERIPVRKPEWPAGEDPSAAEQALLEKYVRASERADLALFAEIIREDAVFSMPPETGTWTGRDTMIQSWVDGGFGTPEVGEFRCLVTRANRQPAVACYVRKPGEAVYRPLAIDVLRIEEGMITAITAFPPDQFEAFGLPGEIEATPPEGAD